MELTGSIWPMCCKILSMNVFAAVARSAAAARQRPRARIELRRASWDARIFLETALHGAQHNQNLGTYCELNLT